MENIYCKNKIYSEEEINNIATINKMITVDCLKDENMISIEKEGEDCLFEFTRIKGDKFLLTWSEFDN